mgnify:CR=1 FL=1
MKRMLLMVVMIGVVAAALAGSADYVYAQTATPPVSAYGPNLGGRGPRGGQNGGSVGSFDGILHDEMIAAYAQKLGMSAAELESRLDAGATISVIAYEKGLSAEQFTTLMQEARSMALQQAVSNGKITQQQADWMSQRGAGVMGGGAAGAGAGRGAGGYNAACPYAVQ